MSFVCPRAASPEEFILMRAIPEPNSGCWLWLGSITDDGYAWGAQDGGGPASRSSYRVFRGPTPANMQVDHTCKTRACVNPDHLQLLTREQNNALRDCYTNNANRRKTHCSNGHALTPKNVSVYVYRDGTRRRCRSCWKLRSKRNRVVSD